MAESKPGPAVGPGLIVFEEYCHGNSIQTGRNAARTLREVRKAMGLDRAMARIRRAVEKRGKGRKDGE